MKIAVHKAGENEPVVRDATPEEEAALTQHWEREAAKEAARLAKAEAVKGQ